MRRKSREKGKGGAVCEGLAVLLLLAVILSCLPLTLPRLAGLQIFQVVSGSMEPSIPTGSLVYVRQTEPEEVEEKDVIAFYSASDTGAVITHRVMNNQVVSGRFITKGDANRSVDVTPVAFDRLIGEVVFQIPMLGNLSTCLYTGTGIMACSGSGGNRRTRMICTGPSAVTKRGD